MPGPDLSKLKSQLLTSGIQQQNQALFQVINQLIEFNKQIEAQLTAFINANSGDISDIADQAYITSIDQLVELPNSRRIDAGDNIDLDLSVSGVATLDVPLEQVFLTGADESATLPNSRELLAGTDITFDDTVAGERTINASGGEVDHVVMSDGATPTPSPVDDGFGNFIYVAYTP
jgi:hypothetical protein